MFIPCYYKKSVINARTFLNLKVRGVTISLFDLTYFGKFHVDYKKYFGYLIKKFIWKFWIYMDVLRVYYIQRDFILLLEQISFTL